MKTALMLLGLCLLTGCNLPRTRTFSSTEPNPSWVGNHQQYTAMKSYPLKGEQKLAAEIPDGVDPFLGMEQQTAQASVNAIPEQTGYVPPPSGPTARIQPGVVRISSSQPSEPRRFPIQQVSAEVIQH